MRSRQKFPQFSISLSAKESTSQHHHDCPRHNDHNFHGFIEFGGISSEAHSSFSNLFPGESHKPSWIGQGNPIFSKVYSCLFYKLKQFEVTEYTNSTFTFYLLSLQNSTQFKWNWFQRIQFICSRQNLCFSFWQLFSAHISISAHTYQYCKSNLVISFIISVLVIA